MNSSLKELKWRYVLLKLVEIKYKFEFIGVFW